MAFTILELATVLHSNPKGRVYDKNERPLAPWKFSSALCWNPPKSLAFCSLEDFQHALFYIRDCFLQECINQALVGEETLEW